MKNQHMKIHIDIFDYDMYFCFWEWRYFMETYSEDRDLIKFNSDDFTDCLWKTFPIEKRRRVYVWIGRDDIWTLIHETNHAIQEMLDYMWIEEQWRSLTELISNLREYILPKLLLFSWHIKKGSIS